MKFLGIMMAGSILAATALLFQADRAEAQHICASGPGAGEVQVGHDAGREWSRLDAAVQLCRHAEPVGTGPASGMVGNNLGCAGDRWAEGILGGVTGVASERSASGRTVGLPGEGAETVRSR